VKTIPLKKIATFMGGGTPSRAKPDYFDGGIPWVKTTDLNNGLVLESEETLSELGLKKSSCSLIPADTVLVAMYGGFRQIGRTGLLTQTSAINQALTAVLPDKARLNPMFLLEWLNFHVGYWKRLAGSSRKDPNITKMDVADFPVPVYPLAYQEAVIALLKQWDESIQVATSLQRALESRKQGLMQQLLTGRRRLKGFKGKWKPIRLGAVLERVTRKNTSACLIPLTVSAQRGLVEQSSYFAKQIAATDNDHYLLLKRGEFAYNRSASLGYPFGAIKRLDAFDEGIVSTLCLCFSVADEEKTDTDFLVGLIEAGLLNRELRAIAHEGARSHGLLNVTATDFFNIRVSLPNIGEQRAMAEVLRDMDTELALRRSQLEQLKTQKRALMQKLLSGEWRLPESSAQSKPISKKGLQPPNNVRKQLSKK
jgi:type I restriction enzyme S subunit